MVTAIVIGVMKEEEVTTDIVDTMNSR